MRLGIKSDGTGEGTKFYDADTGEEIVLEFCQKVEWRANAQTSISEARLSFVNIPVELICPPLMEVREMVVDKKYLDEVVDLTEEIRKFNDGQELENVTEGQRTADQIAKAFGVEADAPGLSWQSAEKMKTDFTGYGILDSTEGTGYGWNCPSSTQDS